MAGDAYGSEPGAPIAAINVTPFVDVVLVLLVIFMITAPALMKDVLGIQLPKTQSADSSKSPASLGVAITRQGQLLLNGALISKDDLTRAARDALKLNPEVQAILSADADARHGDVVTAMDALKTAGLSRFAFQIEREH